MKFGFTPPDDLGSKSTVKEVTRSLAAQGKRHDKALESTLTRYKRGKYSDIQTAINEDQEYRLSLARKITSAQSMISPAQFLMSNYCKEAFRLAVRNGEIDQEQLGRRVRKSEESRAQSSGIQHR